MEQIYNSLLETLPHLIARIKETALKLLSLLKILLDLANYEVALVLLGQVQIEGNSVKRRYLHD